MPTEDTDTKFDDYLATHRGRCRQCLACMFMMDEAMTDSRFHGGITPQHSGTDHDRAGKTPFEGPKDEPSAFPFTVTVIGRTMRFTLSAYNMNRPTGSIYELECCGVKETVDLTRPKQRNDFLENVYIAINGQLTGS
jgi:hypothetical protein